MQHKSLFAAMMVGALVLASCVKNQESQSVTDVRNARADEIKSQAELNRANAEAAVMLAKAQAAIAAAQAELLEAQQAIVEAEAAKMRAEAELAAVEVEIAKVKLEGERVKLQAQKAELEALIAKYEADIAKYAVKKEKALNELAKAEMQAEIDEITMQKKLIDEQTALMKAAAAFGIEKELEVNALWTLYSSAVEELNKAQKDYIHKQIQLAMLQAGEETAMDILADKIAEKQAEVETQELLIAELESRVDVNAATIKSAMEIAKAALYDALSKEEAAKAENTEIKKELERRQEEKLEYEQDWRGGDPDTRLISWFEKLGDDFVITDQTTGKKSHVFVTATVPNPETGRDEKGIYFFYQSAAFENKIKHNVFIPLYTVQMEEGNEVFPGEEMYPYTEEFVYPDATDGVMPTYRENLKETTFIPAKIYTENFDEFVDLIEEIEMAEYENQITWAETQYKRNVAYIEGRMEALEAEMAQRREYVEAAGEEVTAAYAAISEAEDAYSKAQIAYYDAYQNYWSYYSNSDKVSDLGRAEAYALGNVKFSFDALQVAKENVAKLRVELFGVANASDDNPSDEDEVVIGLISKVKALENAAFESAKNAIEKAQVTKKAKEACDDHQAQEEAWEKAKSDLKAEVEKIPGLKKTEQEKLEAYHYAVLVYTADPTDGHKELMDNAEKAWKEAKAAVVKVEEAIPTLEAKVAETYDTWFVYYGPYLEAQDAEALAKKQAYADKEAWEAAKTLLGTYTDDTDETVFGKYNLAKKALGTPKDEAKQDGSYFAQFKYYMGKLKEAAQAVKDAEEDTQTLIELRIAYDNAWDVYSDSWNAIKDAEKELALLIGDPDDDTITPKYPDYVENLDHIYPFEGEVYFKDEIDYVLERYMPGQNYAQYIWYGEQLVEQEKQLRSVTLSDEIKKATEKFLNLKAEVARFAAAEEAYLENVEEIQYLADALLLNEMAILDAQNEAIAPFAAYQAIKELYAAKVYRVDGAGEPYVDIEAFETVIENAKKELIKKQAELADLKSQLIAGVEVQLPNNKTEYLQVMINKLENEIAALEVEIDMLAAKIQGYLEALDQLLTTVE